MHGKKVVSLLAFVSVAAGFLYLWHDTAEAARFGRSRSFGSRPAYQRSAPSPAPASPQSTPGQTTQQKPGALNTPAAAGGRWGGMFGGLLMGGLIGSLLFGGGFGGPGFLDLLLLGGGLFLLMRFIRSRQSAAQATSPSMPLETQAWGSTGYAPSSDTAQDPVQLQALPPGFDAEEFLKGARSIFVRLQTSWDKRDLEDIRQFTAGDVFAEIQEQAKEDPHPGKTELLLINPRIIEVRDIDQQIVASVLYDVMMREDGDETAKQVRELWHFSRPGNEPDAFWLLEGIQQVER
ncbi:MAG: Tim44 domain-containing protein [Desulfobacteraceae bacterium]|nr:MAG: Tim44 domain-containing protein [Desulfobacteraceae bacterium]